jgi:hypothetical protein
VACGACTRKDSFAAGRALLAKFPFQSGDAVREIIRKRHRCSAQ